MGIHDKRSTRKGADGRHAVKGRAPLFICFVSSVTATYRGVTNAYTAAASAPKLRAARGYKAKQRRFLRRKLRQRKSLQAMKYRKPQAPALVAAKKQQMQIQVGA